MSSRLKRALLSHIASLVILPLFFSGCSSDYTILNREKTVYVDREVIVEVPVEVLIEVPVEVEVIVKVPGEGGDVWIDSFDQPYVMDGIDIIWLIDKSGSMSTHAQSVVDGIEQMMLALPHTGWRLGITTMAWQNATSAQQFPLIPGDTAQDAWDAYNNTGNGGLEAGFDAAYAYLLENQYNQSWLRADAGLLVVFVSDENEQSFRDFANNPSGLQDFINWYGNQRPSVFIASIVNLPAGESVCTHSVPGTYVGDRYIDATNAFGGVVVDICAEDWATGVQAATSQVTPHEEWELTYTPIENTVIVFVDSVEFVDWIYNPLNNSIEFNTIPMEGSHVEIGYVIDYS